MNEVIKAIEAALRRARDDTSGAPTLICVGDMETARKLNLPQPGWYRRGEGGEWELVVEQRNE